MRLKNFLNDFLYQKAKKSVEDVTVDSQTLQAQGYFSQWGQDKYIVKEIFKDKRDGYFVDTGAFDGVKYSNTYYMEKELGWKAIVVEPVLEAFEKLKQNRQCIKVHGCIANYCGEASFLECKGYTKMLSGMVDKYDQKHLDRIDAEIKVHGGSKRVVKVPCLTFEKLLEEHNVGQIDYLNIDTEGSELEILESIDFNNIDIKVITVENNYKSLKFKKLLNRFGFQFVAIADDEIYSKK